MADEDTPVQPGYTLEQLSALVGMTPRNIRAYQSRGLLHPPLRAGREARYSSSHAARLNLVMALQRENLSLNAIVKVLADPARWAGVLPVFTSESNYPEGWVVVESATVESLRAADREAVEALESGGVFRTSGEDRLTHPLLSMTATALFELGVDPVAMTRAQAEVVMAAQSIAQRVAALLVGLDGPGASTAVPLALRMLSTGFEVSLHHLAADVARAASAEGDGAAGHGAEGTEGGARDEAPTAGVAGDEASTPGSAGDEVSTPIGAATGHAASSGRVLT